MRAEPSVDRLAGDLALLVDSLGARRAPIVVGHGGSARLAAAFAASFAVHRLLTVEDDGAPVPPHYAAFARPVRDPALARAYASWCSGSPTGFRHLADPQGFAASLRALL
jgi:hypothetical protein